MSNSVTVPSLWDDAKAAKLDEPGLLLYRSNLLGADLRITNFGGGNTSAKVAGEGSADGRARDRAVGEGLGRRHRLDEARRLRHALHGQARIAEGSLQEPRPGRRDGSRAEPLHLRPQSARALDRHLPPWLCALPACRPRAFGCGDRHRRIGGFREADEGDLRRRDGLSALAAPRHRPRHQARRDGEEQPAFRRRRSRQPWPVHLGQHRARSATTPRCASSTRPPSGWSATARSRPSRGRRWRRSAGCRAPRRGAAPAAGNPRPHLEARAQDRALRRFARGAGIREFQHAGAAGAARHLLPRPLPAHQDPPADRAA